MADINTHPEVTGKPKKRPINGRKREIDKKMKLSSHVMGEACNCARLQCFESISLQVRKSILDRFNALCTKDEQDAMIAAAITPNKVKQRRPRKEENEADLHNNSYQYYLLIPDGDSCSKKQICYKALLSIFGVTKSRLERIQKTLTSSGLPPTDQRGKHNNRPKSFTEEKVTSIINHIRSFRGRQSHYTLRDTRRLYLPEELNVTKMHAMYLTAHPGETCSRESYRRIFVEKFNIGFGYPRKDTCSTCDQFKVEIAKDHSEEELRRLTTERELHLRKGQVFYDRKTAALQKAQTSADLAAAAFDFWKNLPTPNITTNDVYYKRQLSIYTFNIHNLGSGDVHLFSYDETVGKKGSNDVASMLLYFFTELLPAEVTQLELFCDSCPGQNKNWTILRFLHYMVHHKKRFTSVKLTFPIRGHSFMECDRDMAIINQKLPVNTPGEWHQHFREARKSPSPFNVIPVTNTMLLNVEKHISNFYVASCPVKTQPLREVIFSQDHPRLMQFRDSWNGPFTTAVLSKPVGKRRTLHLQVPLQPSSRLPLPISAAKFKDLQELKRFCPQEAQDFYASLPHHGQPTTNNEDRDASEIDDEEEDES